MTVNIKNKLKLQCSLSEITEISIGINNIEEYILNHFNDGAIIVTWQFNQIAWGLLKNGKIIFLDMTEWNIDLCQEFRVFDTDKEIYLVKNINEFIGRMRKDGEGAETKFIDSVAPMWGCSAENNGDFCKLKDVSRKLSLTIPADIPAGKYCGLVTRNYVVTDNESGLSGYGDYRYLALQEIEV